MEISYRRKLFITFLSFEKLFEMFPLFLSEIRKSYSFIVFILLKTQRAERPFT